MTGPEIVTEDVQTVKKDKALKTLQRQIDGIRTVKATARFGAEFKRWQWSTEQAIKRIFPNAPENLERFKQIKYT